MKFRSVLCILLASVLMLTVFPVFALGAKIGDASLNGTLEAEDARLALRAAVGLQTLSEEAYKAADVDFSTVVDAADARSILRAAVGLEELKEPHTHAFTREDLSNISTCKKQGEKRMYCECGEYEVAELLPLSTKHLYGELIIDKAPTCTVDGSGHYLCKDCGKKLDEVLPAHHTFTKIGVTSGSKCTVAGCEAVIPSFNAIVNDIKDGGNAYGFTTVTKSEDVSTIPEITGALAPLKDIIGDEPEESTSFSVKDYRLAAANSYYIIGENTVSNLSDSDIRSISIEQVNNVDFIDTLPYNYTTDKGATYDISDWHFMNFTPMYKITVVMNNETTDIMNTSSAVSKFDKIYAKDYNKQMSTLKTQTENELKNSFPEEFKALLGEPSVGKGKLSSDLTLIYYIDAASFKPVASYYKYGMGISMTLDFKIGGLVPTASMTMKLDSTDNSYYIFQEL